MDELINVDVFFQLMRAMTVLQSQLYSQAVAKSRRVQIPPIPFSLIFL